MHPNINVKKRYLSGLYGGVPFSTYINFDELKDIVEQNKMKRQLSYIKAVVICHGKVKNK